jgi:hypothetical protein
VAVACSRGTVHVFYKREVTDEGITRTALVHQRFRPVDPDPSSGDHRLESVDATDIATVGEELQVGRGLWAGCTDGVGCQKSAWVADQR